jgi:hypothetical protein
MGFTTAGLANGGKTAHFEFSYDTTFAKADGADRTNAVLAKCEQDFNVMQGWFAGVSPKYGSVTVQIVNANTGASWSNSTITVTAPPGASAGFVRYLLASELVEQFMWSQNQGWFDDSLFGGDEGSKGEGLSRFLGVQLLAAAGLPAVTPGGFQVVPKWINGGRPNFVENTPDDTNPDPTTGCTACFIWFLNKQLGFSIQQIIAATPDDEDNNLVPVFQKLTGKTDAWSSLINLVNLHYPPGITYTPKSGDNLFPVSDLSQFMAPNAITCGYSEDTLVVLDKPVQAAVQVHLKSDNPALVQVDANVTVPAGGTNAKVTLKAPPIAGPFDVKTTKVHATYAGKTLTIEVDVVSPRPVSLVLSPDTVTTGNSSTATVTLDRASLAGPVVLELICGAPGFASLPNPPQLQIAQGATSGKFVITTPPSQVAFKPAKASVYATYGNDSVSATLTINSKVVAGIVNTVSLLPATVTAGNVSHGTVTLLQSVPTPTTVSLAAVDSGLGLPGGQPGNGSLVATVPSTIQIPANSTSGMFTITTNHNVAPNSKKKVSIWAQAVAFKTATLTVQG